KQGISKPVSEKLLGSSYNAATDIEVEIRNVAYRGIFTTALIQKGEASREGEIAVIRHGEKPVGLHSRFFELQTGGVRAV
ncbi:UNVERIFIED_CONTAM: spore coat protein, partial [Bacillus subtilis]